MARLPITYATLIAELDARVDTLLRTHAALPPSCTAAAELSAHIEGLKVERSAHAARSHISRGDPVVVAARGSTAPHGTSGVAAYISESGDVLLKDPSTAHIKHSSGTWIPRRDLEKIV